MSSSIIIIGASARAATESAVRAGLNVIAIDQFGDRDTQAAADAWLQFSPPAASVDSYLQRLLGPYPDVPVLVVGGFEAWHQDLDRLRPHRPVLAPTSHLVRQLRSLDFLDAIAGQSGLRFPKSIDCADAFRRIKATVPEQTVDWLMKSTRTSAGLGIRRLGEAGCRPSDWLPGSYAQQLQAGRSFGASFLATAQETHLIGVCRSFTHKIPGQPFLYSGSAGPLSLSPEHARILNRLGHQIVAHTGLRGLFGVDLLLESSSNTLWLLEINPRYTASMEVHELAASQSLGDPQPGLRQPDFDNAGEHGFESLSLIHAHLNACLDPAYRFKHPKRFPLIQIIKKVVWSGHDFRWQQSFENQLRRTPAAGPNAAIPNAAIPEAAIHVSLHDLPNQDQLIPANTPILTMLGRWSDSSVSCAAVRRHLKRVENELKMNWQ